MADVRKSLQVLRSEWESCKDCELGVRRDATNSSFVFGEGARNGILFVGEGPVREDEEQGRAFVSEAGDLLRTILGKLQFTDYYMTNLVCCRSCEPVLDSATGMPIIKKARYGKPGEVLMRDCTPLPKHIEACRPRLHEQIYIIDPVLIVATGGTAAEHILGRPITITNKRGTFHECTIPGATLRPVLTDKKQVWGRKIHGSYQLPTETNEVKYTVLLTNHPAYIRRKGMDMGRDSPLRQFAADIRLAVKTYEKYVSEVFNRELTSTSDADLSDAGDNDGD